MFRREFLKTAGAATLLASAPPRPAAEHNFDRYDFGPGPAVADRLWACRQALNADGTLTLKETAGVA